MSDQPVESATRAGALRPLDPLEAESLQRASRFLSRVLDLDQLLEALLGEGLEAVDATRGFVGVVNHDRGVVEVKITAGVGWDDLQDPPPIRISDEPGAGITGLVARTGVPYLTGDAPHDSHYVMYFPDVRSEIAVPLLSRQGRVTGVLNLETERPHAFSHRDRQLLVALASQGSIAISVANYRLREAALIEIGKELAGVAEMPELVRLVASRAPELLRADDCTLFELDRERGGLVVRAGHRRLAAMQGDLTYHLGEGLTGWVAEHGETIRLDHVSEDPRWRNLFPELPPEEIDAYLAAPIFAGEGLWGVIRVVRRRKPTATRPYRFTERDETLLVSLAEQVGAAVRQRELQRAQVQMERMVAWGEMSARSAHMIGNKVFALKGRLNELQHLVEEEPLDRQGLRDAVARSRVSLSRLEEILGEFRDFVTATQLDRETLDLNEVMREAVEETVPEEGSLHVEPAGEPLTIRGDAAKLRRAVAELLQNALSHAGKGGKVTVRTGKGTPPGFPATPTAEPGVYLEVQDNGPGVSAEHKSRLFEPFFTTRAQGMGLGLSIVKGIVDAHGAAIAEIGRPDEGARFVIVFPAHTPGEPSE